MQQWKIDSKVNRIDLFTFECFVSPNIHNSITKETKRVEKNLRVRSISPHFWIFLLDIDWLLILNESQANPVNCVNIILIQLAKSV